MIEGEKREKLYGRRVNSKNKKGKYVKSKFLNKSSDDIAIDATLRAAALRNASKDNNINNIENNNNNINNNIKNNNSNINNLDLNHLKVNKNLDKSKKSLNIKNEDLREKIRKHGAKLSIALVIDMSGSMLSSEKLNRIKAILHKIILNVHINKDKLAVIGFKGKDSEIIIPNTKRPSSFLDKLNNITVGGTTPMAAGLEKGLEILKKDCKKEEYIPMIMVLSDGVTNVGLARSKLNNGLATDYGANLGVINNYNNKKLMNSPINDVLDVGEEIAKYNIHTVIVNFEKEKNKGRSVNKELAFVTSGRFYDLEQLGDILAEDIFEDEPIDKESLKFGSFKSDLSDMVLENILNYERENI